MRIVTSGAFVCWALSSWNPSETPPLWTSVYVGPYAVAVQPNAFSKNQLEAVAEPDGNSTKSISYMRPNLAQATDRNQTLRSTETTTPSTTARSPSMTS